MKKQENFFDWEDDISPLENVNVDIYVNGNLKCSDIHFDKIEIKREGLAFIYLNFYSKKQFYSDLLKEEKKPYNLKIEMKLKSQYYLRFDTLTLIDANNISDTVFYIDDVVKTKVSSSKIVFSSNKEKDILKEWYLCHNRINFNSGFSTVKTTKETIKYKNQNRTSYIIDRFSENNGKAFWIKLDDFKFKVSLIDAYNTEKGYQRYVIEYNKNWGMIPDENVRFDISVFLSFIIGTKLIKLGESYFDLYYVSQKEYRTISPIDISLLYQGIQPFYNDDYRCNDTDLVIKQIPKMMKKFFLLKEKYRLDEVLSTLYVKSYLNFNFISYVTYIEMYANIDIDKKTTIPTTQFKNVLKKLNAIDKIPKKIRDKLQNLNNVGIGKKVQNLLTKNKIDNKTYKDVFSIRGKVVHGAKVEVKEMYIASEKAKELLTILTLKKLGYRGNIRNFTNNDELISMKSMLKIIM